MTQCARHRDALSCELGNPERGIAVHLLDDFFEVAERKLPDGVLQRADWLAGQYFIAFVHRLERVTHRAFAKKLRLTKIRIPAGAPDPAAHHIAASRHSIDVERW